MFCVGLVLHMYMFDEERAHRWIYSLFCFGLVCACVDLHLTAWTMLKSSSSAAWRVAAELQFDASRNVSWENSWIRFQNREMSAWKLLIKFRKRQHYGKFGCPNCNRVGHNLDLQKARLAVSSVFNVRLRSIRCYFLANYTMLLCIDVREVLKDFLKSYRNEVLAERKRATRHWEDGVFERLWRR